MPNNQVAAGTGTVAIGVRPAAIAEGEAGIGGSPSMEAPLANCVLNGAFTEPAIKLV